jgi:pimeloyl-ACP methyl ester carboxylesterase
LLLLHDGTGCYADWVYSGREQFEREYRLIIPDARGTDGLLSENS